MAHPVTELTITNGIDSAVLQDIIDAVHDDPNLAQFVFRAKNRWSYGAHCCTTIQDFWQGGHEDVTRPKPL